MRVPGLAKKIKSVLPINSGLNHTGTFEKGLTALVGVCWAEKDVSARKEIENRFIRGRSEFISTFRPHFTLFSLYIFNLPNYCT